MVDLETYFELLMSFVVKKMTFDKKGKLSSKQLQNNLTADTSPLSPNSNSQLINILIISSKAIIIQTVANNEFIRNFESHKIDR